MSSYEQSSIWKKNLAEQSGSDSHKEDRAHLRDTYVKFRKKTAQLAGEIARDLPDFTVHDITHIDALWEYTDLIIGDDYPLNPAEAFVLGGAFLIHDLGMGLAAYPDGINELKKNDIWKDTAASLFKKKNNRPITESDYNNLDNEIEKQATANTLRLLHAKHAEKLATIFWQSGDTKHFLIDNTELREAYGTIIGKIAHSHWQSVEELVSLFKSDIGAPGFFPNNWTIDPLKLACILRVVDAAQIDDRRAPPFLKALRRPTGISDTHWNFQQKINKPFIQNNRLTYTSKSAFTLNDVDSWWVCYDTLCMIDKELRDVDSLLTDKQKERFKINGITSIEAPERLSECINVENWQPVDTRIKINNIPQIVRTLGGEQLYGNNITVPLIELIQNASDAIRARRILENEDKDWGDIIIRFDRDEHGEFIEVEDNGIGMSQRVLTGPFLDFGQSFWGTSLMHEELPGLESLGFYSTGQYGIGFYSVFMWGDKVSVYTNKCGLDRDRTSVLEFSYGVMSRPLLRKAENTNEIIKNGGTRVRVWLKDETILSCMLMSRTIPLLTLPKNEFIGMICPAVDCNIFVVDDSQTKEQVIYANDWLTISPLDLIKRIIGNSLFNYKYSTDDRLLKLSENMTILKHANTVYGRLFASGSLDIEHSGIITTGGLRTCELNSLHGILVGMSKKASRDISFPTVNDEILSKWATEQAIYLSKAQLKEDEQVIESKIIIRCGGENPELKIAIHKGNYVNQTELRKNIESDNFDEYFLLDSIFYEKFSKESGDKLNLLDNVIVCHNSVPILIYSYNTTSFDLGRKWPTMDERNITNHSIERQIVEIFGEVWHVPYNPIRWAQKKYDSDGFIIGHSNGYEIKVVNYTKLSKFVM